MNAEKVRKLEELETKEKLIKRELDALKSELIAELKKQGTYSETTVATNNGDKVVKKYSKELANGKVLIEYVCNPRFGLIQSRIPEEVKAEYSGFSDSWSLKH